MKISKLESQLAFFFFFFFILCHGSFILDIIFMLFARIWIQNQISCPFHRNTFSIIKCQFNLQQNLSDC